MDEEVLHEVALVDDQMVDEEVIVPQNLYTIALQLLLQVVQDSRNMIKIYWIYFHIHLIISPNHLQREPVSMIQV